jgi:integrase
MKVANPNPHHAKPGITLKKIDGIYHTPVIAKGRTKWISTGCDTKEEATRVLAESGVERLSAVAKAGRLSARAIGQILTGKNLTCLKALEQYRKLKAVSQAKETGLRLSDIAQLEWRSFAEDGKLITWTEKTNKRMELPITNALRALISEVPVTDADYVFPAQRAIIRDVAKRSGLSVQFGRLLDRRHITGKSFHSLRHYRATQSFKNIDKATLAAKLADTLSMEQIATLLGHANSKTTKRYVH